MVNRLNMIVLCVLTCLVSLSTAEISLRQLVDEEQHLSSFNYGKDEGHLDNCGIAKNFTATWSPKILDPRGNFNAVLSFISPYDWAEGEASAALYLKDLPDRPILQVDQKVSCDKDLKKYIPTVQCPFKADKFVHLELSSRVPTAPSGEYLVKCQVKNSNGDVVLCIKGSFQVE